MGTFQVDRNKYKNGVKDIYKKERSFNKTAENMSKSDRLYNGFKTWSSFYRANPHRFVEEYFGIKLLLFQKIILYMMFHSDFWMLIAARGIGKSFIVSVFAVTLSVLKPSSQIVIASG